MAKRTKQDRVLLRTWTPEQKEQALAVFLAALIECGGVFERAVQKCEESTGLNRTTLWRWRQEDPAFAVAWKDAIELGAEKLEDVAWGRAVEGVDKPVTFQGEITDTYKEYSDGLLMFLLKGAKPNKYNRQAIQISGPEGGPVQFQRVERVIVDPKDPQTEPGSE